MSDDELADLLEDAQRERRAVDALVESGDWFAVTRAADRLRAIASLIHHGSPRDG